MADVHDLCKASQVSNWRPQVTNWRPQVTNWRHSDLPLSDLLTTLLRGLGDSLHQKELFISCSKKGWVQASLDDQFDESWKEHIEQSMVKCLVHRRIRFWMRN